MFDLSIELGIPLKTLTYLEKIRSRLYTRFYLRKSDGSKREINPYLCDSRINPYDEKMRDYSKLLKRVHRGIKDVLTKYIELPDCVFGFRPGCNIKDAVKKHVGKKYLVVLDIRNFFPSTTSDDVYNALVEHGVHTFNAWLIARLVAFHGRLPQGAITSPIASNIAFKKYDLKIIEYAKSNGFTYTRYADDMAFSTDRDLIEEDIKQLISDIAEIIKPYEVKDRKVRWFGPDEPHYLLGLQLNKKINVPKQKRRILRAAVHNYVRKHKVPYGVDPIKYKASLKAKLGYVLFINKIPSLEKLKEDLLKFDPNEVTEWETIQV